MCSQCGAVLAGAGKLLSLTTCKRPQSQALQATPAPFAADVLAGATGEAPAGAAGRGPIAEGGGCQGEGAAVHRAQQRLQQPSQGELPSDRSRSYESSSQLWKPQLVAFQSVMSGFTTAAPNTDRILAIIIRSGTPRTPAEPCTESCARGGACCTRALRQPLSAAACPQPWNLHIKCGRIGSVSCRQTFGAAGNAGGGRSGGGGRTPSRWSRKSMDQSKALRALFSAC